LRSTTPTGGARLRDQAGDAGAQPDLAGGDASQVMRILGGMQASDQRRVIGPGRGGRVRCAGKMAHALLATGDGEQPAVSRLVPMPGQAVLGEGAVEGGAMAVALGFGERAIDVEDQRRDR